MMTLRAEDPQTACRHKAQQGCGHHSLVTPIDWKPERNQIAFNPILNDLSKKSTFMHPESAATQIYITGKTSNKNNPVTILTHYTDSLEVKILASQC